MISHNWSPMKRLIWLRGSGITGGSGTYETVTGNPVSFTAKAAPLRQLKVAFSPVQNLNGYDAPWPAGGGKNKIEAVGEWNVSSAGVVTQETNYTAVIAKIKQGQEYTFSKSGTAVSPQCMGFYSVYPAVGSVSYNSQRILPNSGTFTAPIDGYVLARMDTTQQTGYQLEVGSSATSYAPYSNICPISGWSSLTVEQRGKNLFGPNTSPTENNFINESGLVLTTEGWTVSDWIPVAHNTQYTFTPNSTEGNAAKIWFYDADKTGISYIASGAQTFTTPANCRFMRFSYRDTSTDIMLNLGETAEAYVPYNGRSISISLGSTVYGGYVDVCTGVGEITWAKSLLKDLTWSWYYKITGILRADPPKANGKANLLFTSFKYSGDVQYHSLSNGEATGRDDAATIYVCNTAFAQSTIDAWLATLTNDDYVVYELAEPLTIQLTPQEVQSLAGDNVLFSDANGDLTVEYRSN